jgi:hypothetical protein
MDRIRRGFRLVGASWEVLKADRELLLLPVVSFAAIAIVAGSLFGIAWGTGLGTPGRQPTALHYALLAVFYFVAYFVSIFANAAVVGAATIRLQGGDPTLKDGLRIAASKLDKILGWALIAATVGLILRSISERSGLVGRIVIGLIGAAWSAVTFFVVPVLLYEPVGVVDSIKRSGHIFKQRWGEQFTGNASIGLAMFVLMIPAIVIGVAIASVVPALGILVLVVSVGILLTAGAAMSGIFNAALYRYATTGEALGGFAKADLDDSFTPRRRRGFGGFGGGGFAGPLE